MGILNYDEATPGLAGVENSLSYRVEGIEKHFHNRERWCGISADQSGNDWALPAGLNPYQAISGNSDFGSDPNDEAKLMGPDDSPGIAGMVKFDMHRIMITAASMANDWVLRIIWGTGTMADAETALQFSDVMVQEARKGSPIPIMMPRQDVDTKVWLRAKSATNNATIDFFIGIHEYAG